MAKLDITKLDKFADEVEKERVQKKSKKQPERQQKQNEELSQESKNVALKSKQKGGRKNAGLSGATAMITLPAKEKERFTQFAFENGLTFSAFVRLACTKYISGYDNGLQK